MLCLRCFVLRRSVLFRVLDFVLLGVCVFGVFLFWFVFALRCDGVGLRRVVFVVLRVCVVLLCFCFCVCMVLLVLCLLCCAMLCFVVALC